jgi:antitoxin HicB
MESNLCVWRARIARDGEGRYVVKFPEFPEALTDGATETEALANAADALSETLMQRLKRNEPIPSPRSPSRGEYRIAPEPIVAMKLALHEAIQGIKAPTTVLAARLDIDEKEARRLLDPAFPSKAPRLAAALRAMNTVVTVGWFHAGRNGRIPAHPATQRHGATPRPKRAVKASRERKISA